MGCRSASAVLFVHCGVFERAENGPVHGNSNATNRIAHSDLDTQGRHTYTLRHQCPSRNEVFWMECSVVCVQHLSASGGFSSMY